VVAIKAGAENLHGAVKKPGSRAEPGMTEPMCAADCHWPMMVFSRSQVA
jgi:hypothetical protein